MSTAYDYWRTREPDYDEEADAREEWESNLDIIEVIGADRVSELLWDASAGADIRLLVNAILDEEWKKEIQYRIECSYDYDYDEL